MREQLEAFDDLANQYRQSCRLDEFASDGRRRTAAVLPGDRPTPTWRARQEGVKYFGGIFLAIRNVVAHEDSVHWSEHEALEQLASLMCSPDGLLPAM